MRGPAALATYIAWALILGGFVVIFGAWNGAAELESVAAQFPYLVSGGMVGVGFVIAGCALWIVQTTRQVSAERAHQMKRLDVAMAGVVTQLRGPEAAGAEPAGPAAVRRGAGTPAADDWEESEWASDELVVAGRSSYHDPSCHLVTERADLQTLPRPVAAREGLSPCRICKPA